MAWQEGLQQGPSDAQGSTLNLSVVGLRLKVSFKGLSFRLSRLPVDDGAFSAGRARLSDRGAEARSRVSAFWAWCGFLGSGL